MPHVFISYVRENKDVVDRLCSSLRKNQIEVWLDREQLRPGQRWRDAIRSAINSGGFFLACFSKEYIAKERSYMNEELTLAVEELRLRPTSRSWFIPVLLSGTEVPDRPIGGGETLRDIHWVNLKADWNIGIRAIVRAIKESTYTPQAVPPAQPDTLRSTISSESPTELGPSFKTCMNCHGSGRQRKLEYSASAAFRYSNEFEDCSTCKGRGKVPSSMRKGLFGLRDLVDCWNCGRTGIAYNSYYTHCPSCGKDLFPLEDR